MLGKLGPFKSYTPRMLQLHMAVLSARKDEYQKVAQWVVLDRHFSVVFCCSTVRKETLESFAILRSRRWNTAGTKVVILSVLQVHIFPLSVFEKDLEKNKGDAEQAIDDPEDGRKRAYSQRFSSLDPPKVL